MSMMPQELRKFGFNLGLGMNILGCIMFYRHREHFIWFSTVGSTAFMLAILYPKALFPFKKIIDAVIFSLNWIVSMSSLLIAFYLVFTPIAILARLLGKDFLHKKIDKSTPSYWTKRINPLSSKESYERMG